MLTWSHGVMILKNIAYLHGIVLTFMTCSTTLIMMLHGVAMPDTRGTSDRPGKGVTAIFRR